MANVLMIIAQNGFRDEELSVPKNVLERAGHSVKVASITRNKAKGMLGAEVTPDIAVHEANVDFFDAFVVVGGVGSPELAQHREVVDIIRNANRQGKVVAAICLAPVVLAKSGILATKKATVSKSQDSLKLLKESEVVYVDEPVVVDGNIITAEGPSAAQDFGKEIVEMLKR